MGYRIDYPPVGRKKKRHPGLLLALGLLLRFCLNLLVQGQRAVLLRILFPGDVAVTAASLDAMLTQLKGGTPFAEAFQVFCRQVIFG